MSRFIEFVEFIEFIGIIKGRGERRAVHGLPSNGLNKQPVMNLPITL